MLQLRRRNANLTVTIKTDAPQATLVAGAAHRCAVCNTGGPFAWLAYVAEAARRRPVAWLCLHCLELGHSPYTFADQARAQAPDARFVLFPGTSVETEQNLTRPADPAA